MDGDAVAKLIYLLVLLVAILGWFVASNRKSLNRIVQQLSVWAFIFIGFIVVYGMWEDVRRDISPKRAATFEDSHIRVPRSDDGHFYLELEVNGTPVNFLVDTGATDLVLTEQDAIAVGIDPSRLVYLGVAQTANGQVRTAPVELESVIAGRHEFKNVRAWVSEGDSDLSLLGQSFLSGFHRIEIQAGEMSLEI
ncbi:MAG: TIGR02281 family clan AA aspartic protease [Albidovulum sp.]|nr:TIGR02281 family clan AA aspartic protease [Albidovulum sp.]MDE0531275.1 TIGR02281 family clan AA aspartic protease [Albidovulum sp.]